METRFPLISLPAYVFALFMAASMTLPAQAAFNLFGEKFTAKPIEFTVVDSETGKPIEGATAVAIWQYRSGLEGGAFGPFANILEATSDRDGKIRFPGWGPVHLEGKLRETTVSLFKSDYVIAYAANWNMESNAAQQDFDYHGRSMKMKKFSGSRKQYARDLEAFSYSLWTQINYMGWGSYDEPRCDWKRFPKILTALMDEEARLRREGIVWGLLPTQLAINDAKNIKEGCGSSKAFLGGLRK